MFRSPDIFPPRQMAACRMIWMILIVGVGCSMAIMDFWDVKLHIAYKPLFIYLLAVCAGVSLFYRFVAHEKAIFMLGESIAQLLLASFVLLVAAAMGAHLKFPLADDALSAVDTILGFSWPAHAAWFAQHPAWIGEALRFAYSSYGAQIAVLIPMLFFYHHSDHGQRMVLMFMFSGLLAALLATCFPAEGPVLHYGLDHEQFLPVPPAAPLVHAKYFTAMRAGESTVVFPAIAIGSFPSLHAILGVMLAYASVPLRRTRWVILPLNVALVIATPYHSGDYLIDIILGIVLGFTGIYWAESVLPPRSEASSPILNQLATETEKEPLS